VLTILHVVRIPVEITYTCLYLDHQVPEIMTFAGGNYDIISGLTAPVLLLRFCKNLEQGVLLGWNSSAWPFY
jgi:hypothetical protein